MRRAVPHARRGAGAPFLFFDGEMDVRQSGDLRKVRDSNDLMKIREVFQALPHRLGHAPADADVDLIEYQHGEPVRFGQYALERKHDAGDFPPGGDPDEGLLLLPQVRGDEELDVVISARVETDLFAPRADDVGVILPFGELRLDDPRREPGVIDAELAEFLDDGGVHLLRDVVTFGGEASRDRAAPGACRFELPSEPSDYLVEILGKEHFLPDSLPVSNCAFDGPSVFPLEQREFPQPIPERLEAFRVELDPRVVPLYELGELAHDGFRRSAFLRRLRKLRVDPGNVLQLVPDDDKEVVHGLFSVVEHAVQVACYRKELFGVFQNLQLPFKLFFFTRAGRHCVDFGDLKFVELLFLRKLTLPPAQVLQLPGCPPEEPPRLLKLRDNPPEAPEVVEHADVRFDPQERLVLVLAVEIHEKFSHLFLKGERRGTVGDEGPALPLG